MKQHGQPPVPAQPIEQPQDAGLNGDVQRVVGSSAISTSGSHAKAIAIWIRWRIPPLN